MARRKYRHRRSGHSSGSRGRMSGHTSSIKGGMMLVIFLCVFGSILLLVGVVVLGVGYDIGDSVDVEIIGTVVFILGVVLLTLIGVLCSLGRRRHQQHVVRLETTIESQVTDDETPLT